ncbi:MAG: bifunctional folylpolyglutamate synthase/dihydrofolate synthase, partial [Nitriliruptoraceae bacterium]
PEVIKVVGTDGKTSVAHLLEALLTATGRRVGATTSPHLERIDERIRIDAGVASPQRLGPAVRCVRDAVARLEAVPPPAASCGGLPAGERLSFFEVITAIALQAFADAQVDLAVVEAGIGGSGDATAALPAPVTVLTPVGLDHPQLGATLAEVAREKAGVLPVGGTLVSAPQTEEVDAVLAAIVAERGGRWLRSGVDHGVIERHPDEHGQTITLLGPGGATLQVWLPLWGVHQAENAATALAALHAALGGWPAPQLIRAGLAQVAVPGRTESLVRAGRPEVVLDGAHDGPALDALIAALAERPVEGDTVVLLGVSGGRDLTAFERRLRAVSADIGYLDTQVGDAEVAAALTAAEARAGALGRIVVTGSLHLVGAVRAWLGEVDGASDVERRS